MKKFFLISMSLVLFVSAFLQAQNWSIPKESSEVNWATPERSYDSTLEDPVGYNWSSDIKYTLRIPNAFANDAPLNRDSKYTFAFANPIPSKGYTTTTFVYGPDSYDEWKNVFKTPIVINGETVLTPKNESSVLSCKGNYSTKQKCEELYKLPGGNFSWITNYNSQITYIVARAKDDPSGNTLILWAIHSTDSRYRGQSTAPQSSSSSNSQPAPAKEQPQTNSSASWTAYANAYAFPYNDTSVHTYTLIVPNKFKDIFRDSKGNYKDISDPSEKDGYTTIKFRAYMENDDGDYWLHFEDTVSFAGLVPFLKGDFASVDKKDDTSYWDDDDPDYSQALFSNKDKRHYFFVRSQRDPYTIILRRIML